MPPEMNAVLSDQLMSTAIGFTARSSTTPAMSPPMFSLSERSGAPPSPPVVPPLQPASAAAPAMPSVTPIRITTRIPASLAIKLENVFRKVLVLKQLLEARLHVVGRDRDLAAAEIGRLEGELVEEALEDRV